MTEPDYDESTAELGLPIDYDNPNPNKGHKCFCIEIVDAGHNRLLKACEKRRVPQLTLSTCPGSKILIFGGTKIQPGGVIFLTPDNCQLLGGAVQELLRDNHILKRLSEDLNKPIPGQASVPTMPAAISSAMPNRPQQQQRVSFAAQSDQIANENMNTQTSSSKQVDNDDDPFQPLASLSATRPQQQQARPNPHPPYRVPLQFGPFPSVQPASTSSGAGPSRIAPNSEQRPKQASSSISNIISNICDGGSRQRPAHPKLIQQQATNIASTSTAFPPTQIPPAQCSPPQPTHAHDRPLPHFPSRPPPPPTKPVIAPASSTTPPIQSFSSLQQQHHIPWQHPTTSSHHLQWQQQPQKQEDDPGQSPPHKRRSLVDPRAAQAYKMLDVKTLSEVMKKTEYTIGCKRFTVIAFVLEVSNPLRIMDDNTWTMSVLLMDESLTSIGKPMECIVAHELLLNLIMMTPKEAMHVKRTGSEERKKEGAQRLELMHEQLMRMDLVFDIEAIYRQKPTIKQVQTLAERLGIV